MEKLLFVLLVISIAINFYQAVMISQEQIEKDYLKEENEKLKEVIFKESDLSELEKEE